MKHDHLFIDHSGKSYLKKKPQSIFTKLLNSPAGRATLAAAMVAPLKRKLDYQGLAQKVLNIQPLASGACPTSDRDINVADIALEEEKTVASFKHDKLIINSRGKSRKRYIANRVVFPEFEIMQTPWIRINGAKEGCFDIIDDFKTSDSLVDSGNKKE